MTRSRLFRAAEARSPTGFALVVALHAAALGALVAGRRTPVPREPPADPHHRSATIALPDDPPAEPVAPDGAAARRRAGQPRTPSTDAAAVARSPDDYPPRPAGTSRPSTGGQPEPWSDELVRSICRRPVRRERPVRSALRPRSAAALSDRRAARAARRRGADPGDDRRRRPGHGGRAAVARPATPSGAATERQALVALALPAGDASTAARSRAPR